MKLSIPLLLSVPLLALALASGVARGQGVVANVKQDAHTAAANVKQDVRDLAHGNIAGAHERHKRVLSSAHRRHMSVARCLARYGRTWCGRHGYATRHWCKTRSGHWVHCSRRS